MSRKRQSEKRSILPDPLYNSTLVHMFVNRLMKQGKKNLAYNMLYTTLQQIKQKLDSQEKSDLPLQVLEKAVRNVQPTVQVKPKRVGGSVLQVPLEVKPSKGTVLAIQWILTAARKRSGPNMVVKLSNEIIDASNQTGGAMKRKTEVERMAEANKAFARFRF
jgi:small subunit ribosomal protein S7